MKLTTLAIAFGPPVALLCLAFFLEPEWLVGVGTWTLLALGAVVGVVGAAMARAVEHQD